MSNRSAFDSFMVEQLPNPCLRWIDGDLQATHRISWSDHQGLTKYRDVMLEGTNLFSKTEWDAFASTDWRLVNGKLTYRNQEPIFSECTIEAFSY